MTMPKRDKNALSFAIVIAALLISSSVFYLGYSINKDKVAGVNTVTTDTNVNTPTQQVQQPKTASKVSMDDDPVYGNKDAKVAIVEFSDFECPFCARHSVQTNPQIEKNYVDNGKVKIVYRDTPFHGSGAIEKANAANCVNELVGGDAYFKMKNAIYKALNVEQKVMDTADLKAQALILGANEGEYDKCVAENRYLDEINKDLADSRKYNINGTPTFVIGKVVDGNMVEGEVVSGAQPYAVFKAVLDKYVK